MTHFEINVDIQAPVSRVWEVMFDVERWPEWTATLKEVRKLQDAPLEVGSRVLIRQPKLPPALWKMTEIEPGRSFTWMTKSPGVRVVARHGVAQVAGGTRATLSLDFEGLLGPLVARLTRGLNQRYLGIEARGLKARSESTPAV